MNVNGRPKNWGQGSEYKKVRKLSDEHLCALHVKVDAIRSSRMVPKEPAIVRFERETVAARVK
jgi:hypothetical protein